MKSAHLTTLLKKNLLTIGLFLLGLSAAPSLANEHVLRIHNILPLLEKGYDGSGQTVGVLDVGGSQQKPDTIPKELAEHFAKGSWFPNFDPDTQHGASVAALISSQQQDPLHRRAIAPGAKIDYTFSDEVFVDPLKDLTGRLTRFKYARIANVPSTLEAIEKLTQGQASVINVSRTIPLRHSKRVKTVLTQYLRKGGILVTSLGNQGISWDRARLDDLEKEIQTHIDEERVSKDVDLWDSYLSSYIGDSLFFRWMSRDENRELFDGTLFIAALDQSGRMIHPQSNAAGTFAPDRTLLVIGDQVELLGDSQNQGTGTSYSAAIASGVFALLHQAYPHCRPSLIAQAMLDSASYADLGFFKAGIWYSASAMNATTKRMIYGRGRLDALAAYHLAAEATYCHSAPSAYMQVATILHL